MGWICSPYRLIGNKSLKAQSSCWRCCWIENLKYKTLKMLKGIPTILAPELLKILMEMGHGDELVIADGNFPGASHAQRLVRCDGHGVPPLLEAILQLFPLDSYVKQPAALMAVVPGDKYKPEIWPTYKKTIQKHEPNFGEFEM